MCCRYAVNEAVIARYPSIRRSGDVRPSDAAPAIVADGVTDLSWGFERQGKQLVINARSETAWEKPMFREAMALRRCALPAAPSSSASAATSHADWLKEVKFLRSPRSISRFCAF